jgi:hypothetical protein
VSKVICCDLDGVIFDYNDRVRQELIRLGSPMREWEDGKDPNTWHWYEPYGATREDMVSFQEASFIDPAWWEVANLHRDMTLPARMLLRKLCYENEVYFTTYRPRGVREATRQAISDQLGIDHPHVILTGAAKEMVIQGIGADVVIEDHLPTLLALKGPKRILVSRAYNHVMEASEPPIHVVPTTRNALEVALFGVMKS